MMFTQRSLEHPLILFCIYLAQFLLTQLKGPKLEIFVAEFFTQSKPVWVDDLGTRK